MIDIGLLKDILSEMNDTERDLEEMRCSVYGVTYSICKFSETNWDDEGKYQYQTQTGTLCSLDDDYNIIEEFDVVLTMYISRSGSYYTDYYYDYSDVEPYKSVEVVIPEEIIPEHIVERLVKLEL